MNLHSRVPRVWRIKKLLAHPRPLSSPRIHLPQTGGPTGPRYASRAGQIKGENGLLRGKDSLRKFRKQQKQKKTRDDGIVSRSEDAGRERAVAGRPLFSSSQPPLSLSKKKKKIGALRRYAAVFGLDVSGTCTRDELIRAIARHWDEQASFSVLVFSFFLLALSLARARESFPFDPLSFPRFFCFFSRIVASAASPSVARERVSFFMAPREMSERPFFSDLEKTRGIKNLTGLVRGRRPLRPRRRAPQGRPDLSILRGTAAAAAGLPVSAGGRGRGRAAGAVPAAAVCASRRRAMTFDLASRSFLLLLLPLPRLSFLSSCSFFITKRIKTKKTHHFCIIITIQLQPTRK